MQSSQFERFSVVLPGHTERPLRAAACAAGLSVEVFAKRFFFASLLSCDELRVQTEPAEGGAVAGTGSVVPAGLPGAGAPGGPAGLPSSVSFYGAACAGGAANGARKVAESSSDRVFEDGINDSVPMSVTCVTGGI